ncbi:MAG: fructose-bisphosphatase class II family protein [Anaerolineales bacterium]|nr:fructose-bisphosphatase class II family protein [Anaerolineales bacterium]
MEMERPSRNIGLDLVRVTETVALMVGRWVGSGNYDLTHKAACQAMADALNTLDMQGRVVFGEEDRLGPNSPLCSTEIVGLGDGPEVDVLVDPIDGTNLVIRGLPGAVSLVCVAPRDTVWSPVPAKYMEKIIVDQEAADVLLPECLDAPAAWTLALIARAKNKAVRDLSVVVLNRERHEDLVAELRAAGVRVMLRDEADSEAAFLCVTPNTGVDLVMGVGGASQGVMTACIVKAMRGAMLMRLAPQSDEERALLNAVGLDYNRIMTQDDIVKTKQLFIAITGVTNSTLLPEMQYFPDFARTHSYLIRAETGTVRYIKADHAVRL